jgi:hypothetical protein
MDTVFSCDENYSRASLERLLKTARTFGSGFTRLAFRFYGAPGTQIQHGLMYTLRPLALLWFVNRSARGVHSVARASSSLNHFPARGLRKPAVFLQAGTLRGCYTECTPERVSS